MFRSISSLHARVFSKRYTVQNNQHTPQKMHFPHFPVRPTTRNSQVYVCPSWRRHVNLNNVHTHTTHTHTTTMLLSSWSSSYATSENGGRPHGVAGGVKVSAILKKKKKVCWLFHENSTIKSNIWAGGLCLDVWVLGRISWINRITHNRKNVCRAAERFVTFVCGPCCVKILAVMYTHAEPSIGQALCACPK